MLIITFIFPGGRIQGFTILSPSHFWVVFYLGSQVKNLSGILRLHVFSDFWFLWVLIFFSVYGYFCSLSFGGPCFCGFCMFPDLVVCVFIVLAELQDFMYWIFCISCPLELYQNSVGLPTWAIWCSSEHVFEKVSRVLLISFSPPFPSQYHFSTNWEACRFR